MTRKLVYVDLETTGLDPFVHQAYEVAWAVEGGDVRSMALPHTLDGADPESLRISGYFERDFHPMPRSAALWRLGELAKALNGVTLVAANPAFDAAFLRKAIGCAPWHYRLWDIEVQAATVFRWPEARGQHAIAEFLRDLGHDIPVPDHTAEADVRCLRACHNALRSHAA